MGEHALQEPADHYSPTPTSHSSTGSFITTVDDLVLLAKPSYVDFWSFPGGVLEPGEAPHVGCARETAEELGLRLPVGPLLVVDWSPASRRRALPVLYFMFDLGTVDRAVSITMMPDEIDDYAFLEAAEAARCLPPPAARRLFACIEARRTGRTVYLPAGATPAR